MTWKKPGDRVFEEFDRIWDESTGGDERPGGVAGEGHMGNIGRER